MSASSSSSSSSLLGELTFNKLCAPPPLPNAHLRFQGTSAQAPVGSPMLSPGLCLRSATPHGLQTGTQSPRTTTATCCGTQAKTPSSMPGPQFGTGQRCLSPGIASAGRTGRLRTGTWRRIRPCGASSGCGCCCAPALRGPMAMRRHGRSCGSCTCAGAPQRYVDGEAQVAAWVSSEGLGPFGGRLPTAGG